MKYLIILVITLISFSNQAQANTTIKLDTDEG